MHQKPWCKNRNTLISSMPRHMPSEANKDPIRRIRIPGARTATLCSRACPDTCHQKPTGIRSDASEALVQEPQNSPLERAWTHAIQSQQGSDQTHQKPWWNICHTLLSSMPGHMSSEANKDPIRRIRSPGARTATLSSRACLDTCHPKPTRIRSDASEALVEYLPHSPLEHARTHVIRSQQGTDQTHQKPWWNNCHTLLSSMPGHMSSEANKDPIRRIRSPGGITATLSSGACLDTCPHCALHETCPPASTA
jgi:hypothetical protein